MLAAGSIRNFKSQTALNLFFLAVILCGELSLAFAPTRRKNRECKPDTASRASSALNVEKRRSRQRIASW